jgi:hypothetical protein
MREIKFRAWDGKRILDDFYVSCRSGKAEVRGEVFDWTLMQYTGLKDKNGKEIYEGDVVRWSGKVYLIEWHDKVAGFVMQNNGIERPDVEFESEVIGNIYESPNLLNT